MKVIKSAFLALALTAPLLATGGVAYAAEDDTFAVRVSRDYVCYYDRKTLELIGCRWE